MLGICFDSYKEQILQMPVSLDMNFNSNRTGNCWQRVISLEAQEIHKWSEYNYRVDLDRWRVFINPSWEPGVTHLVPRVLEHMNYLDTIYNSILQTCFKTRLDKMTNLKPVSFL